MADSFCPTLWTPLLVITGFTTTCSLTSLYLFSKVLRSYLALNKSERTNVTHLGVFVCFCGMLEPPIHLLVPFSSSIIRNQHLHSASLLLTGILAFTSVTGLFVFELKKLHGIFKDSTYKPKSKIYRIHLCNWAIGSLCFAAWMLINEETHEMQTYWHVILLLLLALVGGLMFMGAFISVSWQLGRRLIDLVVSTQKQVELQRRRTTSLISLTQSHSSQSLTSSVSSNTITVSINSDESSQIECNNNTNNHSQTNVSDSSLIMAMPGSKNNSISQSNQKLPTIYDDTETDDMEMEQPNLTKVTSFGERAASMMRDFRHASLDDFGTNQRPFLESTGRQFVFSFMTSLAVLMIVIATICWSLSSCFELPSIMAFMFEQIGFGIGVLRLYLSDPERSMEYECVCGPVNDCAVKVVSLVTNVQLKEELNQSDDDDKDEVSSYPNRNSNNDNDDLESESAVHFQGSFAAHKKQSTHIDMELSSNK